MLLSRMMECDPWDPHGRRELIHTSCPLTYTRMLYTHTYTTHTHTQYTHQINNIIKNTLKQLKEGKVYSSSWFEQTVHTFHHGANVTGQELEQLITLSPATVRKHGGRRWTSAGFLLCIWSETPAGKGLLWVGLHTSVSAILY